MRDESLRFLERLVNTPSPSGHEARGQRVWLDYVKPFADETFSDAYGNTVAVLNKGGLQRGDAGVAGVNGSVPSAYSSLVVQLGQGPYQDASCASNANTCRWGDYAGAVPDPYSTSTISGVVWGTNQFSTAKDPISTLGNWQTKIFAVQP